MPRKIAPVKNFSYRSGVETNWRCPRAGYLEQFYLGTGIQKSPHAYWLDVGNAVHLGLARFLEHATHNKKVLMLTGVGECLALNQHETQACIQEALDFWDTCGQREVLHEVHFTEQRLLIECLLWAFYYHTLPTFLQTYEILWVEKEITEIIPGRPRYMFMSRPDAIVRDRSTGELVVISWKTIDDPNEWRRLFFKQDLQGMTEAWWAEHFLHSGPQELYTALGKSGEPPKISYVQTIYLVKGKRERIKNDGTTESAGDMFAEDTASDLAWRQNSHLVYAYSNLAEGVREKKQAVCGACNGRGLTERHPDYVQNAEEAICLNCGGNGREPAPESALESLAWKYQYVKPGNVSLSTLGTGHKKMLITQTSKTPREWVEALHRREVFPSTLPTEANESPLSKVIVWEAPSYRDPALMTSVIQQVKESERKRHRDKGVIERQIIIFKSVCAQYAECGDAAALENFTTASLPIIAQTLDKLFPQQLTSCSFPWRCQFQDVCHTEDGRRALAQLEMPKGYAVRMPHHSPEAGGE